MITGANLTNPREYLPVTSKSIIWKGRYKLITNAPPTNYYTRNDRRIPDNSTGCGNWGQHNHNTTAPPCLFDLLADESETSNLAAQLPNIVQQLHTKLLGYAVYTSGSMSQAELSRYECVHNGGGPGSGAAAAATAGGQQPNSTNGSWPWGPPAYRATYRGPCCWPRA